MTKRTFTTTDLLNTFLGFPDYTSMESPSNYPPTNIYSIGDDSKDMYVDVAVAGFKKSEITITCNDNNLVIKGSMSEDNPLASSKNYHKRGISTRDFSLSWVLSPKYEVSEATMEDGILTVTLKYVEQDSIQKINIK